MAVSNIADFLNFFSLRYGALISYRPLENT